MPQRALSGIHPGSPWPLGSSLTKRGVNFVLAAPGANRIELLLYSNGSDRSPERVIELDGRRHRSGAASNRSYRAGSSLSATSVGADTIRRQA